MYLLSVQQSKSEFVRERFVHMLVVPKQLLFNKENKFELNRFYSYIYKHCITYKFVRVKYAWEWTKKIIGWQSAGHQSFLDPERRVVPPIPTNVVNNAKTSSQLVRHSYFLRFTAFQMVARHVARSESSSSQFVCDVLHFFRHAFMLSPFSPSPYSVQLLGLGIRACSAFGKMLCCICTCSLNSQPLLGSFLRYCPERDIWIHSSYAVQWRDHFNLHRVPVIRLAWSSGWG